MTTLDGRNDGALRTSTWNYLERLICHLLSQAPSRSSRRRAGGDQVGARRGMELPARGIDFGAAVGHYYASNGSPLALRCADLGLCRATPGRWDPFRPAIRERPGRRSRHFLPLGRYQQTYFTRRFPSGDRQRTYSLRSTPDTDVKSGHAGVWPSSRAVKKKSAETDKMAAEPIVEGARAVQEHPGDRSGTQTATRGAPRSAPTTTDGPDANPRVGKRVNDVLHRQITNVHGKPLLFREMEQRRREGSWHGWASHGTRSAPSTGTA